MENEKLKQYVERIEKLEEEKAALQEDIKQVYAESKSTGFDGVIIRKIVALRKKDEADVREEQELLALYARACGMSIFD